MTTLVALDRCSEVAHAALRQISLADLMQKRELGHPDRDALKAWHMTPDVEFLVQDARNIALNRKFSAVFSTFDSLNHVMNLDELEEVFRNVHAVLADGGTFEFDLNMEEAYRTRWCGTFGYTEDDHACVVRGSRDDAERTGRIDLTMFELKDAKWERTDLSLLQRWYPENDVRERLRRAGFGNPLTFDGKEPIAEGAAKHAGRMFFVARR